VIGSCSQLWARDKKRRPDNRAGTHGTSEEVTGVIGAASEGGPLDRYPCIASVLGTSRGADRPIRRERGKQESIRNSYCSSQVSGHRKLLMYEVTEDGARTASSNGLGLLPIRGTLQSSVTTVKAMDERKPHT
jgi:hypothetical protein